MRVGALIVAAGHGSRAGGEIPKQYRILAGRSVLSWSIEALFEGGAHEVVVAIAAGHEEFFLRDCAGHDKVRMTLGGATRTESVLAGLAALGPADAVLIHDAARPGLRPATVRALTACIAAGARAAAPALPVTDSVRRINASREAGLDVPRAGLMRVQTPQAFALEAIQNAYASTTPGAEFTDDLSVAIAAGETARFIPGDHRLLKLTYPEDFAVLETMLGRTHATCVGSGFDAHRFGPGAHVTLCGVRIAHEKGLLGHSDADAGWHALVDAILGALGEGDIGVHFPPADPKWKNANSEMFLRHAADALAANGARLVHVDITLICEAPKISPHRAEMRARTAAVLQLPLERVSVKATTTEGMGFTGRGEGIAAQALATIERPL